MTLLSALQCKDHCSAANPASARQQIIMSAMVKSPDHQQGPTSLAPSSSGRRKDTPTPEGEWRTIPAMREFGHTDTWTQPEIKKKTKTCWCSNDAAWLKANTNVWKNYSHSFYYPLLHTFQKEGGSHLKVSCTKSCILFFDFISLFLQFFGQIWKALHSPRCQVPSCLSEELQCKALEIWSSFYPSCCFQSHSPNVSLLLSRLQST